MSWNLKYFKCIVFFENMLGFTHESFENPNKIFAKRVYIGVISTVFAFLYLQPVAVDFMSGDKMNITWPSVLTCVPIAFFTVTTYLVQMYQPDRKLANVPSLDAVENKLTSLNIQVPMNNLVEVLASCLTGIFIV